MAIVIDTQGAHSDAGLWVRDKRSGNAGRAVSTHAGDTVADYEEVETNPFSDEEDES